MVKTTHHISLRDNTMEGTSGSCSSVLASSTDAEVQIVARGSDA